MLIKQSSDVLGVVWGGVVGGMGHIELGVTLLREFGLAELAVTELLVGALARAFVFLLAQVILLTVQVELAETTFF